MDFLGEHKVKLDSKGRLRIPGSLKSKLNPDANETFVITRGFDGCLELYPMDIWKKVRSKLRSNFKKFDRKSRMVMRGFLNGATDLKLDGNDRINVPNHLLQFAGIKNEVYLTPGEGTIEMWSVERYDEIQKEYLSESFESDAQDVLGDINLFGDDDEE